MKNVIIVLGISLIFCGMLSGCRKSKKYIGRYVSEDQNKVLEIKKDGTYKLEETLGAGAWQRTVVATGKWEITEGGYLDGEGLTLYNKDGFPLVIGEKKGNTFIDRYMGRTVYVKQK